MPDYAQLGFTEVDPGTLKDATPPSGGKYESLGFTEVKGAGIAQPTVEEFNADTNAASASEFGRGISRSILGAGSNLVNFARIFTPAAWTNQPFFKSIADELANQAGMIPTKAGSIKDVLEDPSLAPAYVGRVLGELAPQAVAAYLTAGTGAAIGRGIGLGAKGVRIATGLGAAATSVPQEVGSIYGETESAPAALAYGIPAGALDALSAERIIGKVFREGTEEARRRTWRKIVHDVVKDIPKSAGVESVTEATQEGLALLANKSADDTYHLLNQDNGWRILEAAVAGAIGGGILGGGLEAVQLPAQKQARNQQAATKRLTRIIRDEINKERAKVVAQATPAPVPATDQTGTIEEPTSEPTTIDQFLAQNRRGFIRTPSAPVTDETGTSTTSEGVTTIDEFLMRQAQPVPRARPAIGPGRVPASTTVVVQSPQEHAGQTVPGYVQIDLYDESGNNTESTNPDELRSRGFNVPAFESIPQGKYTFGEASLLSAMTPEEQQDYLQRKENDTKNKGQVRAVQPQRPTPVQTNVQEKGPEEIEASGILEEKPQVKVVGSGPIAVKVGNTVYAAPSGIRAMIVDKYNLPPEQVVPGYMDRNGNFYEGPSEFKSPQAPPIPKPAPGQVAETTQAQGLPADTQGVRTTIQAPAATQPQVGEVDVTDIGKFKTAANPDKHKTKIEILYDPATTRGGKKEPKNVTAFIYFDSSRSKDAIYIQVTTGGTTRTVWSGSIKDLKQAGIASVVGDNLRVNTDKLWASKLLTKSDLKDFVAYKLPTEKAERSGGVEAESVVTETAKANPLAGAVLAAWNRAGMLNEILLKNLARIGSQARVERGYAAKDSTGLGKQSTSGIIALIPSARTALEDRVKEIQEKASDTGLTKSQTAEIESIAVQIGQLGDLLDKLRVGGKKFGEVEAQAAATLLSSTDSFNNLYLSAEEREHVTSQAEEAKKEDQTSIGSTGDEAQFKKALKSGTAEAFWDPAQVSSYIDRLEDTHPELYRLFNTSLENEEVWAKIKNELVKLAGGNEEAGEALYWAVVERRGEGLFGLRGGEDFEEHQWLTGISAQGKDGIVSLLNNRNIQLDPQLRRIGLALLKRISEKYLRDLTFSIDATGTAGGEFIPWLKTAKIAIDANNPDIAAHEISHYLASFLTNQDRAEVAKARADVLTRLRSESEAKPFLAFLDAHGGSATSAEYIKWKTGRDVPPSQIASASAGGVPFRFATSTEINLRQPRPFGITPDRDGFVPSQSLLAKMKGQITKDELAALDAAIPGLIGQLALPGKIHSVNLANTIRDQGPQLEVVKLDAHKQNNFTEEESQRDQELNIIHHEWYDNLRLEMQHQFQHAMSIHAEAGDFVRALEGAGWTGPDLIQARRMWDLIGENENWNGADLESESDSATFNYQFVNPKPLKDMPGAVDILVRVPIHDVTTSGQPRFNAGVKFRGGHFGSSDKNIVGWVRGYVETLPDGEKVFHVFEVQSDWAAWYEKEIEHRPEEAIKAFDSTAIAKRNPAAQSSGIDWVVYFDGPDGKKHSWDYRSKTPEQAIAGTRHTLFTEPLESGDPVLAYYESAALKAAIRHAAELGITKIAVSDAETAALTEGHDRVISIAKRAEGQNELTMSPDLTHSWNRIIRNEAIQELDYEDSKQGELAGGGLYHLTGDGSIVIDKLPFIGGDQSHYDQSLPGILKKLTGSQPVVVDFGVHQNVLKGLSDRDLTALVVPHRGQFRIRDHPEAGHFQTEPEAISWLQATSGKKPRKDLLFGGKTHITARMFDISKVDTDVPAQMYRSSLYSVADPYYHLINDDEFFAHGMSETAAGVKELNGFYARVKDILASIMKAVKEWFGAKPELFEQLTRKFERGEFIVEENGGMLYDRNNTERPRSLPPISSLTELRKYQRVEQGVDEAATIRTLAREQNQPLVGHALAAFNALPRRVRAVLPGVSSRLATLTEANRQVARGAATVEETPLRHYAVMVNALAMQQEAREINNKIQGVLDKVTIQALKGSKASLAEASASQLEEIAQESISSYKNFLLSEQRRARNDGVAQGLNEAIKSLDSLRDSTESLKRAIEFIADGVTLEELNNPALSTTQIIDKAKERIIKLAGVSTWQEASLPAGLGKPGVANEQLRIAVRVLQENQNLVQDLITHKELSDPNFAKIMREGEAELDKQVGSLNHRQLRSFLKTYRSVTSAKDRARNIYLKHRVKLKYLIEEAETLQAAEDFIADNVTGSPQFNAALKEATAHGFMSATIFRDGEGNDVTKRIYHNPLNMDEQVVVIDSSTKAQYLKNLDAFEQAAQWFEDAQNDERISPLDRASIQFELQRIYEQELNNALYDPATGKRVNYPFSIPSVISNLVGNSLTYAMNKIGGRSAVQAATVFQARSEARRRVAEVRREMEYPMQQLVLDAIKAHAITGERWVEEIAEPILASFNSIGSKQIKAGDITRFGQTVNGKDMAAIRGMKAFSDAMIKAASDMDLQTAKLHPIRIKEVLSGKEILRPQQGGTENIMPRRFNQKFIRLLNGYVGVKNGRQAKDVVPQLIEYLQSGLAFEGMFLSHVYSINRYPDYVGTTKFRDGYREIYKMVMAGNAPATFSDAIDIVFREQSGQDVAVQMTKEEIAKDIIINEMEAMANRVLDQSAKDRAADTPGQLVRIDSANNFMTNPRGQMIAPDGGYQYSITDNSDIRWMTSTVLEAHEQIARDALVKIQKMLQDYVAEWKDKKGAQALTKAAQLSGEDWLNLREAKQMLNQINLHLDRTSPEAFRSFIDHQFGGIAQRTWSIIVQSLLQSATVLKNNFLGMNLRQWQSEMQWRGDGVWAGMPRWLLKLPTIAKNSVAMPMRDVPAYVLNALAHKRAIKKGVKVFTGEDVVGEDALRAIINNPELAQAAAQQVGAETLRRAVYQQRLNDIGAGGTYGVRDQIERYIKMGTHGGSLEQLDPTQAEKVKGVITSALGLFQETGGGFMLPKALAPRKLEQFLNFQAARHADRLLKELELNIKEAIRDRAELGSTAQITDAELLGDPKAAAGNAWYMRKMFGNAGINLDAIVEKLRQAPKEPLLTPAQWNGFVLEVLKEMNMPSADNRVQFKSGFGKLMSSLMGYGFWYNERLTEALAHSSRKKVDPAALYRGLAFLGTVAMIGIFAGTPLQRLLKRLLYDEEDQTGHFSADNTAWRNAGVLWEQTAPFWPVTGSIMNQLYDARTGGGKIFNFLPVTIGQQMLQSANEIGQTGNALYPLLKLTRLWFPNTKIIVNRLPDMEGLVEVQSGARILRGSAAGDIEVRTPKGGGAVRYSPISTEMQMAVNEMAKESPDYDMINQYRDSAVKKLVKAGADKKDAQRRFDLGVLSRYPENTVFGRPLTPGERSRTLARLTPDQTDRLERVEQSFDRYAQTYGLRTPGRIRQPGQRQQSRSAGSRSLSSSRLGRITRRRSSRLTRNRSVLGRRRRRLTR